MDLSLKIYIFNLLCLGLGDEIVLGTNGGIIWLGAADVLSLIEC